MHVIRKIDNSVLVAVVELKIFEQKFYLRAFHERIHCLLGIRDYSLLVCVISAPDRTPSLKHFARESEFDCDIFVKEATVVNLVFMAAR